MAEYIERDKAIEAVRSDPMGGLNYKRILTDIPAADVAPVVHSTWIENGDPLMLTCGNCGYGVMRYNNTRFCPNCGAKMDGGDEHG